MESEEFAALCKTAKPVSIATDEDAYSIDIVFDNGVSVTIETDTFYDSAYLSFTSNADKEKQERVYQENMKKNKEAAEKKQSILNEMKSKYSPQEWDLIKDKINLI